MKSKDRSTIKIISLAIIALMAWLALGLQLYVLVSNTPENGMNVVQAIGRFFIFFTVLSNILVALCTSIVWLTPGSKAGRFFLSVSVNSAIALYILIVGLVYNVLLRSLWHPEGLQKLADELLHVAVPVAYLAYWFVFGAKSSLNWMHPFRWLIFPSVYLVYALTRGALEGFYPYPFIDANTLSFGRIFINVLGLMTIFMLLGLGMVAISKKLTR